MAKAIIRIRREGIVVKEKNRRKPRKAKTVKVKAKRWNKVPASQVRAEIDYPTRDDLTKPQWEKWGDNLRVLRNYGYVNAEELSLSDSNDAVLSIERMSNNNFCYGG